MRFASQLTFCSPIEIHRRMVIEQNDEGSITKLFCIDDDLVEPAQTLFFDGIISAGVVSIKKHFAKFETDRSDYQYIDFSREQSSIVLPNEKPLLIDFGTNSIETINLELPRVLPNLSAFSAYEIIAACTYYPALIIGEISTLSVNRKPQLIIWEGLDLVNKRITNQTQIREIGRKKLY